MRHRLAQQSATATDIDELFTLHFAVAVYPPCAQWIDVM